VPQLSDSKGVFWLAALLDAQRVNALIGYSTGKGQGFKGLFGDLMPCVKEVSNAAATILIYLWKKKKGGTIKRGRTLEIRDLLNPPLLMILTPNPSTADKPNQYLYRT